MQLARSATTYLQGSKGAVRVGNGVTKMSDQLPMPLSLYKALVIKLPYGTYLHYEPACGPDRTERWRINGQAKTWKSPSRQHEFRIPIKHGLRDYYYLTDTNVKEFHLEEECPYGHN